jgi:hypothetical protein
MKMDPVQVLFRHLETAEFVPKRAGCRVVVPGYQVGLECQAVLTVLEDLGHQVVLVHHPFLVRHHFQLTQMLQVEFHLVVGCNFLEVVVLLDLLRGTLDNIDLVECMDWSDSLFLDKRLLHTGLYRRSHIVDQAHLQELFRVQ